MAINSKQIGWSQEAYLLYDVYKALDRLIKVTSQSGGGGGGTGTVTSFSAGNLSPLFTTNVATSTTTPTLTFTLSNQNANLVYAGPTNGAAVAPTFRSLVAADIPNLSGVYQPLDADLTAISALGFTALAFLKKTAANTWALDTNTYLTANQTITLSGDVTGSGSTGITTTLATVNPNVGTFGSATQVGSFTVNGKGLITAASAITMTPAVGSITGLGTGIATWLATPSWTNFNSAITGTSPFWNAASGATLTGANTITSNAQDQLTFTGTWTATTNTTYNHISMVGSLTARATASDTLRYLSISPTLVASAATQTLAAFFLNATFTPGAFTPTSYIIRTQLAGTDRFSLRDDGTVLFQSTVSGTYGTFRDATNIHFRVNSAGSVFLGNSSSARIGSSTNNTSTFLVTGGSITYQADGSHFFTTQSVTNLTLASNTLYSFVATGFTGASGSNIGTAFLFSPTINVTAGTIVVRGLVYNPTLTDVTGVASHYGLIVAPAACQSGFGTTTPTAKVHIAAGTATAGTAPLKLTSGTNLTTAEAGAFEYNGTNLFFTRAGTTREGVLTQSAITTEVIVSDTSVTVNIGGVTYRLLARA